MTDDMDIIDKLLRLLGDIFKQSLEHLRSIEPHIFDTLIQQLETEVTAAFQRLVSVTEQKHLHSRDHESGAILMIKQVRELLHKLEELEQPFLDSPKMDSNGKDEGKGKGEAVDREDGSDMDEEEEEEPRMSAFAYLQFSELGRARENTHRMDSRDKGKAVDRDDANGMPSSALVDGTAQNGVESHSQQLPGSHMTLMQAQQLFGIQDMDYKGKGKEAISRLNPETPEFVPDPSFRPGCLNTFAAAAPHSLNPRSREFIPDPTFWRESPNLFAAAAPRSLSLVVTPPTPSIPPAPRGRTEFPQFQRDYVPMTPANPLQPHEIAAVPRAYMPMGFANPPLPRGIAPIPQLQRNYMPLPARRDPPCNDPYCFLCRGQSC